MAAPALDQNLGSRQTNAGGTTITLTTSAAAAANTRILVYVGCQITVGTPVDELQVTGGGLTFYRTTPPRVINGNNVMAIFDAKVGAAGLASGTVLTAAYTSAPNTIGDIAACSFTDLNGTCENISTTTGAGIAAWTNTLASVNTNDVVFAVSMIDSSTATANAPSTGTEIHDTWLTGRNRGFASEYAVVTTPGSQTLSGTFSGMTGSTMNLTVAIAVRADDLGTLPGRLPLGV